MNIHRQLYFLTCYCLFLRGLFHVCCCPCAAGWRTDCIGIFVGRAWPTLQRGLLPRRFHVGGEPPWKREVKKVAACRDEVWPAEEPVSPGKRAWSRERKAEKEREIACTREIRRERWRESESDEERMWGKQCLTKPLFALDACVLDSGFIVYM